MNSHDEIESDQLEILTSAFREQLLACLEECSRGRRGLFSDYEDLGDGDNDLSWPEAARLRELASALQSILAQEEKHNPLCDDFLELCTIHGDYNPGEPRLARAFLQRIEAGQVGTQSEQERKPW